MSQEMLSWKLTIPLCLFLIGVTIFLWLYPAEVLYTCTSYPTSDMVRFSLTFLKWVLTIAGPMVILGILISTDWRGNPH